MSEARIDRISNENNTGGPTLSGITTFSGQNYFVPPRGTTAERPSDCPPGSIRFNTDGAHLEYFDGLQWLELEAFNVELGVNGALGNRGLTGGGQNPATTDTIQYITISTLGNSIDFGNLTDGRGALTSCSSSTRGVFADGWSPGNVNTIDYVTISSTGDAIDFGDTTEATYAPTGTGTEIRGIFAGGYFIPAGTYTNGIDYITISSKGNAVDFGSLSGGRSDFASFNSSTRSVFAGGVTPSATNIIEYITTSSLGNTSDFGDLTLARRTTEGGISNSTRGVIMGGQTGGPTTNYNIIEFVNISSTGNATDFGDLLSPRIYMSAMSSPTRGVFGGGYAPTKVNTMEYITIATTGNSISFGQLIENVHYTTGCSNGHGGL